MFMRCDFCGNRAKDVGSIRAVAGGFNNRWKLISTVRLNPNRSGTVNACKGCAVKYNMVRS